VEHWRTRYEDQRETVATLTANYESERRRSNTSAKETKEKQSQIQLLQRQVSLDAMKLCFLVLSLFDLWPESYALTA